MSDRKCCATVPSPSAIAQEMARTTLPQGSWTV